MRLQVPSIEHPPVILSLARALGVSVTELRVLLKAPRVLPIDLDEPHAVRAVALLASHGIAAALVPVPPSLARCASHPSLTADATCQTCSTRICPICLDFSGLPRCAACTARLRRSRGWRRLRVGVLLAVLAVVALLALRETRARSFRTTWKRPLQVRLILVSTHPLQPRVSEAWQSATATLEDWFDRQGERYHLPLTRPIRFELADPQTVSTLPAPPADQDAAWWLEARAAYDFRNQLEGLVSQDQRATHADITLIVALEPTAASDRLIEGAAEAGGTLGYVRGVDGDLELHLEAQIVAHELLHCLGALDAYQPDGHPRDPEGLPEPSLQPRYPQHFAEVMAGELALAPGAGRLPENLGELQLGPRTARAIHWLE